MGENILSEEAGHRKSDFASKIAFVIPEDFKRNAVTKRNSYIYRTCTGFELRTNRSDHHTILYNVHRVAVPAVAEQVGQCECIRTLLRSRANRCIGSIRSGNGADV